MSEITDAEVESKLRGHLESCHKLDKAELILANLDHSSDLLKHAPNKSTRTVSLDAHLLALSSKKVRQAAEEQRKHLSLYDDNKFQEHLKLKLKYVGAQRGWIDMGMKFNNVFRRTIHLEFMYGGVDRKPIDEKVEPLLTRIAPKKSNEPVVASKYICHNEKTARDQMKGPTIDHLCLKVASTLIDICEKKSKINLFEFTVDPDSFTKTVSNLFLTSFLVKKRQAKIFIKEGIPYIKALQGDESFSKSDKEGVDHEQSQVIINITKKQWGKLANTLDLKEPVLQLP